MSWRTLFESIETVAPHHPEDIEPLNAATANYATLQQIGIIEFAREAKAEAKPLTVLVNDPHRVTDTPSFLAALIAILDDSLCVEERPDLRMVVSQGSHRASSEEMEAFELNLLGHAQRHRMAPIVWHTASDEGLMQVGSNAYHPWMAERGFYLACGSLEPHYFAGCTGAHKTLTVGVWAYEALQNNHAGAMLPGSTGLCLDGNPVYDGFKQAIEELEQAGCRILVVNQVICNGALVGIFGGHPIEALHAGIPLVKTCFASTVHGGPVDLVVAQMEPPLDRDLYQADKGIKNTEGVVRDGGVLLLDAACDHGVGITHFLELMEAAPTYDAAISHVNTKGYRLGDHKAVKLRMLTDGRSVNVGIVSPALSEQAVELEPILQMRIFASVVDAADWAKGLLGAAGKSKSRSLLVQDAGNLTLVLEDTQVVAAARDMPGMKTPSVLL